LSCLCFRFHHLGSAQFFCSIFQPLGRVILIFQTKRHSLLSGQLSSAPIFKTKREYLSAKTKGLLMKEVTDESKVAHQKRAQKHLKQS
jgi:hypothetical protein